MQQASPITTPTQTTPVSPSQTLTTSGRYTTIGAVSSVAFSIILFIIMLLLGSEIASIPLSIVISGTTAVGGLFYFLFYLRKAYRYTLTETDLAVRIGIFNSSTTTIQYRNITDIILEQNILHRFLGNMGTLHINTAGTGQVEAVIMNIDNPVKVKEIISARTPLLQTIPQQPETKPPTVA